MNPELHSPRHREQPVPPPVVYDEAIGWERPVVDQTLRTQIEAQDLSVRRQLGDVRMAMSHSFKNNGALVLRAPTGAGKSLYGPLAAREVARDLSLPDGVVVLEPRRDAASGIGTAMAAVAGERLGSDIGFSTSETKMVRMDTSIKVVTPGIFLRWLKDGSLTKERVGALVIDEAHESSLDYHLIYGLIKLMRDKADAPPVVFLSATPDVEKLKAFYGLSAEDYFEIEGKPHHIYTHYLEKTEPNYLAAAIAQVESIYADSTEGDLLVFLPSVSDINFVHNRLAQNTNIQADIFDLHGKISLEQRKKILSGRGGLGTRRIILSTNIAETSVTVPGVHFVVDSGRERDVRFDPEEGIVRKSVGLISQSQAEQRQGRVGRTSVGHCYRLYTEEEFRSLPKRPVPQVFRENLAHVILQIKNMGIDPASFPFFDQPPQDNIGKANKELQMLGALDATGTVTDIGKEIGDLKFFEPRIGRMLIEAKKAGVTEAALVIAAFEREHKVFFGIRGNYIKESENEIIKEFDPLQEIDSDWLLYLRVFRDAFDNFVYPALEDGNRQQVHIFYDWCRQKNVNAKALLHIAGRLEDYADCLGQKVDARFISQVEQVKKIAIGRAILAAHPDAVLLRSSDVGGYVRIADVAKLKKPGELPQRISLNPHTVAKSTGQFPDICVGLVVDDRGLWIDAAHSISFADLLRVTPHLLDGEYGPLEFLGGLGELCRYITYYPIGAKGLTGYELGSDVVSILEPSSETAQFFAQALFNNNIFPNAFFTYEKAGALCSLNDKNQKQVAYSKLFNLLSLGEVPILDLQAWYARKLVSVVSLQDIYLMREQLEVKPEDVCSPAAKEKIEHDYPTEVNIGGHILPVEYRAVNGACVAYVRLNSPDLVDRLDPQTVPLLGPPEHPLKIKFIFDFIISDDISVLKKEAYMVRVGEAKFNLRQAHDRLYNFFPPFPRPTIDRFLHAYARAAGSTDLTKIEELTREIETEIRDFTTTNVLTAEDKILFGDELNFFEIYIRCSPRTFRTDSHLDEIKLVRSLLSGRLNKKNIVQKIGRIRHLLSDNGNPKSLEIIEKELRAYRNIVRELVPEVCKKYQSTLSALAEDNLQVVFLQYAKELGKVDTEPERLKILERLEEAIFETLV